MLSGASSHLLSTRSAGPLSPESRRHLNVTALRDAISALAESARVDVDADGQDDSRKRPSSPSFEYSTTYRSSKRVKLDVDTSGERVARNCYEHTLTLGFTMAAENDNVALSGSNYEDEETDLCSKIQALYASSGSPAAMNLGVAAFLTDASGRFPDVHLVLKRDMSKIDMSTATSRHQGVQQHHIVRVPALQSAGFESGAYGFGRNLDNALYAALVLHDAGLAQVSGNVYISYLEHVTLEPNELPFQVQVHVEVALLMPLPHPYQLRPETAEAQRRFLSHIFSEKIPIPDGHHGQSISTYYSILQPAPLVSEMVADALQPNDLLPTLLPFQRRSLAVMLAQEGKAFSENGDIVACDPRPDLPPFWKQLPAPWSNNSSVYYNSVTGQLLGERPIVRHFPGLFVAEEMGLGKTLECIALMLLNPLSDRVPTNVRFDAVSEVDVADVRTTLVITPPALASQWVDECQQHAPSLRVFVYSGYDKFPAEMAAFLGQDKGKGKAGAKGKKLVWKRVTKWDEEDSSMDEDEDKALNPTHAIASFFQQHVDVVITTYGTLQQDLGVARAPVKRPRRESVQYGTATRERSPLIRVAWGRIIMDEAQMVGAGKAAEMVALIPRLASFAVSGTPAKASVGDLHNTLKFIRAPDVVPSAQVWNRLLLPGFANEFAQLFSSMTVRHLKSQVKDELTIPPQTRSIVPISLGRVERQVYGDALDQFLQDLGIGDEGASEDLDAALLRSSLRQLRGLCTHPMVGQLQRQDKNSNSVKSIGDVLDDMIEATWKNWMDDRRLKLAADTRRAQLIRRQENVPARDRRALDILLATKAASELHVADIVAELERLGVSADEEEEEDNDEESSAAREARIRRRALQARLREANITRHKVVFLLGDTYHALGEAAVDGEKVALTTEENRNYEEAEALRKTILRATATVVKAAMGRLEAHFDDMPTQADQEIEEYDGRGGIASTDLMEQANELFAHLAKQADLILEWRLSMRDLLLTPLTSEDEPADGEEYGETLDVQSKANAYIQEYPSLLADRRESLTSDRSVFAAIDNQDQNARQDKNARRQLQEEAELANDHMDPFVKKLRDAREELRSEGPGVLSLKFVASELNRKVHQYGADKPEGMLAKEAHKRLRSIIHDQERMLEKFESADIQRMRRVFNDRVQYFRQLQELSDTVAEVQWDDDVDVAVREVDLEAERLGVGLRTKEARLRYLRNMAEEGKDNKADNEDQQCCVLCRSEFHKGLMTPCAHVFCEDCLSAWLRRGSKACPVCRIPISNNNLQRITVQQNTHTTATATKNSMYTSQDDAEHASVGRRSVALNIIDPLAFKSISSLPHIGSYGSKINTLIKHLLYIEREEPGAKSIVFSAWADSLKIIEHALIANGISSLRVDSRKSKENAARQFRTDPNLQVFLLHGERENAGLNVTCAQRVFLVEPVVNHSFEVQAISRVDRMGQTHNTEVFCYYAEDSVEENILKLAAHQGLSMYTENQSHGTLDATAIMTANVIANSGSPRKNRRRNERLKGDFVADVDDLLAVMFPHVFQPNLPEIVAAAALRTNDPIDYPIAGPSNS